MTNQKDQTLLVYRVHHPYEEESAYFLNTVPLKTCQQLFLTLQFLYEEQVDPHGNMAMTDILAAAKALLSAEEVTEEMVTLLQATKIDPTEFSEEHTLVLDLLPNLQRKITVRSIDLHALREEHHLDFEKYLNSPFAHEDFVQNLFHPTT